MNDAVEVGRQKRFTDQANRRQFLGRSLAATASGWLAASLPLSGLSPAARAAEAADDAKAGNEAAPREIGSRRELFVDDALVERLVGKAELRLHHPTPREVVFVHDAPWEGSGSGYHSIFQDGPLYRMYYKAWQLNVSQGKVDFNSHPLYCCYAESDDGIAWRRPELGLVEFAGSKANNITMASEPVGATMSGEPTGSTRTDPGHPAVFKDENPDAPADARYKALVRCPKPAGLLPMKSADGLRWSPMSDQPTITAGAFDSQNLAFWDPLRGEYRAYWRFFTPGPDGKGVRAIRTATSADFLSWSKPQDLTYADSPLEHLYTNQVKPYHRAPHIYIGFPTRYTDRGWSPSMKSLPEKEHRELRSSASPRYGTAVTEGLLMASRDGVHFKRWNEAFLRPGMERPGTWNYGHQYIGWHVVETASSLEGGPNELSLYASESYWTGNSNALRRYTLRLDGFVSAAAPMSGGELVTKPLKFAGETLNLNFSTSAAGGVRVELQDAAGQPVPGYALADCDELFGDTLQRQVTWRGNANVGPLAGKPVRLRFALADADVYAFQFTTG